MADVTQAQDSPHDEALSGPHPDDAGGQDTEDGGLTGPDFRSHARINNINPRNFTAIYNMGQVVYLKGSRGVTGPYWIERVHSDGKYKIKDESGRTFRDNVKERDLQPP